MTTPAARPLLGAALVLYGVCIGLLWMGGEGDAGLVLLLAVVLVLVVSAGTGQVEQS